MLIFVKHLKSLGDKYMQHSYQREAVVSSSEMKNKYETEYPAYQPDPVVAIRLKSLIKDKKVTIVLGQWCSDSQIQVPRFYKILDDAGVNDDAINVICVDKMKKAENGLIDNLHIEQVPTFIFTQNNREIGRITEQPITTLENDMVILLEKNIL